MLVKRGELSSGFLCESRLLRILENRNKKIPSFVILLKITIVLVPTDLNTWQSHGFHYIKHNAVKTLVQVTEFA